MNNALTIPLSPSLDSFDLYQQQVQAIPLLTEQEEMNLAKKLHEENDLNAARQLIMSHLRLVIKIARSYSGYGLNQSDLVQEGNIGLMKAVKRFDPSRGVTVIMACLESSMASSILISMICAPFSTCCLATSSAVS